MDLKLTKNGDLVLCILYKVYLENIARGQSYAEARKIGDTDNIDTDDSKSKLSNSDVYDICNELIDNGLIERDILGNVEFKNPGIIYMENRFEGKLAHVLAWIEKIKAVLPIPGF